MIICKSWTLVFVHLRERILNTGIDVNILNGLRGMTMSDNVNHPSHYCTGKYECIDVMVETQGVEAVKDFCICNAFKYLYRHNGKNAVEDVKKANWYLNKYLELMEVTNEKNNKN